MAMPSFAAAGSGAITSNPIDVPYPAGISAGHLLIAHVRSNLPTTIPAPAGWTLISGPAATANCNTYAFGKSATGSESGTQSFTASSGTDLLPGRMYRFIDWLNDATFLNNFESISSESGSSATVNDVGVTTTAADRLAVNLVNIDDDNAVAAFTGQTGGTWVEAVAEYTTATGAPDTCLQIQTANMASAGTINGGTLTMLASDPFAVIGFAILPSGAGPTTFLKDVIQSGIVPWKR